MKRFAGWTDIAAENLSLDNAAAAPNAAAECADCGRRWKLRVIPYLWMAGFEGDVTLRGVTAPIDVSIGKMLDFLFNDLNFAALGQIEASNGKFGVIFNGLYMDISPDAQIRRFDFDTRLRMSILDLTATYDLQGVPERLCLPPGSLLQVLAGTRYYAISGGLTVTGPRGNSATTGGTEEWLDPIIGGRLRVPLRRCLTAQVRGDIGGFGIGTACDFSWNIEAMVEYRRSERTSFFAGYRWLDIDRTTGSGSQRTSFDLNMNGPVVGFVFDF